jgi:hypothetical protein
MKVRDLITLLQQLDPFDEAIVSLHSIDVEHDGDQGETPYIANRTREQTAPVHGLDRNGHLFVASSNCDEDGEEVDHSIMQDLLEPMLRKDLEEFLNTTRDRRRADAAIAATAAIKPPTA